LGTAAWAEKGRRDRAGRRQAAGGGLDAGEAEEAKKSRREMELVRESTPRGYFGVDLGRCLDG
jgi:hypothetical protein